LSLLGAAFAALWIAAPAGAMGGKPALPAASSAAAPGAVEPEVLLVKTLIAIKNNKLDVALTELEKVLHSYPNFRLAHLIRGDLLLARAHPLRAMGAGAGAPDDRVADLRQEARAVRVRAPGDRAFRVTS
jgi:hypothetical protein